MSKKTIVFVICLFLFIAIGVAYIFSELYTESDIKAANEEKQINKQSKKFKEEYESLNGVVVENTETVLRTIEVSEENPFEYITTEELIKKINNKESFIVYFGYASNAKCRSVIATAISSAKENNIQTIYYVDITGIRDIYELNDANEAIKTYEGSEDYYTLLSLFDNVLANYQSLTYINKKGKTVEVSIDEKRIYAPNFIAVKDGVATELYDGTSKFLTDDNQELTESVLCDLKEQFNCFFANYNVADINSCSTETMC